MNFSPFSRSPAATLQQVVQPCPTCPPFISPGTQHLATGNSGARCHHLALGITPKSGKPFLKLVFLSKCNIKLFDTVGNSKKSLNWTGCLYCTCTCQHYPAKMNWCLFSGHEHNEFSQCWREEWFVHEMWSLSGLKGGNLPQSVDTSTQILFSCKIRLHFFFIFHE